MKTYVTIKNLPGGIKTGTTVKKVGKTFVYSNDVVCPFDPTKEPEFFKEVFETKYKKGDNVYLTEEFTSGKRGLSPKNMVTIFSAEATSATKAKYVVLVNHIKYNVTEKDFYIPETYFFLSSKGIIQYEVVTDDHKSSFAYKFRKASANYFETKELAQAKLTSLI